MVVLSIASLAQLKLLYSMSKHHTKSYRDNNIPVEHSVKVINLVHKNVKPICNTEFVPHNVTFNLIQGWNKISISAMTNIQLIYIEDVKYNSHVSYAPFIPYTSTKPFNCSLEEISKFSGKYLYLNITKYTYGGYSALIRLKTCLDSLDLNKKIFELIFDKATSLIRMKLKGKLNNSQIKSILHKCTSNYCGFLSKIDKFANNYTDMNITNMNNSIVSKYTIRNYTDMNITNMNNSIVSNYTIRNYTDMNITNMNNSIVSNYTIRNYTIRNYTDMNITNMNNSIVSNYIIRNYTIRNYTDMNITNMNNSIVSNYTIRNYTDMNITNMNNSIVSNYTIRNYTDMNITNMNNSIVSNYTIRNYTIRNYTDMNITNMNNSIVSNYTIRNYTIRNYTDMNITNMNNSIVSNYIIRNYTIRNYTDMNITNMNNSIVSNYTIRNYTIRNYTYLFPKQCVNYMDTVVNASTKWNIFLLQANNEKINLTKCIINNIQREFIPHVKIELTANKSFLFLHINSNISKKYILSPMHSTNSLLFKCHSHIVQACRYGSEEGNDYIEYILLIIPVLCILVLLSYCAYTFTVKENIDPHNDLYMENITDFKEDEIKPVTPSTKII